MKRNDQPGINAPPADSTVTTDANSTNAIGNHLKQPDTGQATDLADTGADD